MSWSSDCPTEGRAAFEITIRGLHVLGSTDIMACRKDPDNKSLTVQVFRGQTTVVCSSFLYLKGGIYWGGGDDKHEI